MARKEKKKKKKHVLGKLIFLLILAGAVYIGYKYFRTEISDFIRSKLPGATTHTPTGVPTPTPYNLGGVTIKCYGGEWDKLDSNEGSYKKAKEFVESKYNIVLKRVEPLNGEDDYGFKNDAVLLKESVEAGEPLADIVCMSGENLYSGFYFGLFADSTAYINTLQVGNAYKEAGTWKGKTYGLSYDSKKDSCFIIYDRAYIDSLGLEQPSKLFIEGKWNYDEFEKYLRKLKEKLPENVYPLGLEPYEWLSMASAASGKIIMGNDGKVDLNNATVAEALRFYQKLEAEGLVYPMSCEYDEDFGFIMGYDYVYGIDSDEIVLKTASLWDLPEDIEKYGIVYWPWGYNIGCSDYYLTLPSDYRVPVARWTVDMPVKASCDKYGIDPEIMTRIIYDYHSLCSEETVEGMYQAWKRETTGETVVNSTNAGRFAENRDNVLYEWATERAVPDYSSLWSSVRKAANQTLCAYSVPEEALADGQEGCENEIESLLISY